MLKLLLIAVGGAVGATSRYLVAGWGQSLTAGVFPVGTLIVNVTGCFAIGFLGAAFAGPWLVREEYRFAIMVGVLGGFTTFSTFGWETFSLLRDAQPWPAAANVIASNGIGLAAVWIGYRLAERLYGV